MKKPRALLLAVGAAVVFGSTASADMIVQMLGDPKPYTAIVQAGSDPILGYVAGDVIKSFCLEKREYFTPGNLYTVESLAMYAKNGGGGATDAGNGIIGDGVKGDPLDVRTAWLYSNYLDATGGVASYTANQVQNVVWFIEQEITSLTSAENTLLALANTGGAAWGTDYHGVMVMNLVGDYNPAQSQVIREKRPPSPAVPAPAAAVLGMIGLGMVNFLKRRFA